MRTDPEPHNYIFVSEAECPPAQTDTDRISRIFLSDPLE
jgi:hypothetical protein